MKITKINRLSLVLAILAAGTAHASCEKHWIHQKSSDGSILILEDRSVWQVLYSSDRIDTRLWLPMEDVVICEDDKMTNLDDKETVDVRQVR